MAPRTLQTAVEISGVLSPSLEKAINEAVDRLDKMSDETLASAGAAEKLTAEIRTQEKVLDKLRRGYADMVVEGRQNSTEAQRLAREITSLSGDLNQNKQKLKSAEQAAEAFDKALEEVNKTADRSSEGYTVMKDALGDLVSDGIGMAIDAFKELALEGDTALAMLEARTGAAGEEMSDMMYNIYNANYGESLGAVSEALSTVMQMTDDLDNATLEQITKNAITLESVFGYDVKESMRAVNSLTKQFGITADEAFNLVVQGAQNGLDQNGDLLDTINEYAVQFKNAGYSADDMLNMLANGAEVGTWSVDKLGDAVKEMNIRMSDGTANEYLEQIGLNADSVIKQFNKGGPEAQKAIAKVMKALQECDDETLQYQAGVGLMGTMFEDLGAEAVVALMQTEGAIDSAAAAMEQLDTAAYDTLGSSLSALGRTIESEVAQPIVEYLTPGMQTAIDFVTNSVGPVIDYLMPLLSQLGALIMSIIDVLVALAPVVQLVADVLFSSLNATIESLMPVIASLQTVFEGLLNFITGVFTGDWEKAWDGVVDIFGGLWSGLEGLVKTPINAVIGLVNGAIGALNGINVDIPDWVPKFGGKSFGINIPKIPMLAAGGFTDGVSIAGEAGTEAVISFDKAYRDQNISIWRKAGQLLGIDGFSLGSLVDGTNIVIYNDFSNFTWSPQIQSTGSSEEGDLMARLKAHEAEFFDWLDEFIEMREVAQYA